MSRKKLALGLFLALLVLLAAYMIIARTSLRKDQYLVVSGRAEADEVDIAARIQGKLKDVLVEDGDRVSEGQVIARLDREDLDARREETVKETEQLKKGISAKQYELDYTDKAVRRSIEEAEKRLSLEKARLRQAEAREVKAGADMKRAERLLRDGVISTDRYESEKLASDLAGEDVNSARRAVEVAEVVLAKARDSTDLVDIKKEELSSMRKALEKLDEKLRQVDINIGYTEIKAPADGLIMTKVAEPGEYLPPGGVVAVMIKPQSIHIKTYVPERDIGRISLGMEVWVVTDAYPASPVKGHICYIADNAEFTPKEVQSHEERVKQVFAVKVCFEEIPGVLKKGMPVDVRFGH